MVKYPVRMNGYRCGIVQIVTLSLWRRITFAINSDLGDDLESGNSSRSLLYGKCLDRNPDVSPNCQVNLKN